VKRSGSIASGVVENYLALGLRLGRHIPGFVDAYYGPAELADKVALEAPVPPKELVATARALLGAIDGGESLNAADERDVDDEPSGSAAIRRRWIRSQVIGLLTSARILSGERVDYSEEVQACYGVRPRRVSEEIFLAAHKDLDEVVPGTGPLAERMVTWRESLAIPPSKLRDVVQSLTEDLRERTELLFGLPDGEHVEFVFVTNEPWSGFNYYLGNLHSRVAINLDLPVLSSSIAHIVAHESYPGHHTEHSRKEVGLVRSRRYLEESIFLVGTPQCLIAEGLADLGLEVVMGRRPEKIIAEHLGALDISYDADAVAVVAEAGNVLSGARANACFRLHEDCADKDTVVEELARFALLPRVRAEKQVEFLTHPTWGSYITCYVEGLPLCRNFVSGRSDRFERLLSEQLIPSDLIAQ
jgi:hypothetical protein